MQKETLRRLQSYERSKRVLDVIIAILGLILTIPFLGIFVLAIKLDNHGPVIYKQLRLGKYGQHFQMIKLRTMIINAEVGESVWARKDDLRVTRVGRVLRRFHLDELPQLCNVLKGDMSLVGPRPERPDLSAKFNEEIPGFEQRLQVTQGITGWSQINGGYDLTPKQKLALDLEYVHKRSLGFDLYILLKTIIVIFSGAGAR